MVSAGSVERNFEKFRVTRSDGGLHKEHRDDSFSVVSEQSSVTACLSKNYEYPYGH